MANRKDSSSTGSISSIFSPINFNNHLQQSDYTSNPLNPSSMYQNQPSPSGSVNTSHQQYQESLQRLLWQQRLLSRQQQQQQQQQQGQKAKISNEKQQLVTITRTPLSQVPLNVSRLSNSGHQNDYSNNYIHTGKHPSKFIMNISDPIEGYPKLQKLFKLKELQVQNYSIKPYGCRVEPQNMVETLFEWINKDKLVFDVIMIGALTENQFIYPLLSKLPIDKLCSKPGFLFIWATTQKISELTKLLSNNSEWSKKFRRSEELVFVPVDKNSPYYPYKDSSSIEDERFFEKMQWHCWMCITGTVRRSTDNHLINCNINTDLAIETDTTLNSAVPSYIYKVAENFSSSTRRLHIIPSRTGYNKPVRVRPGWVVMSPDVLLNNFDPTYYKQDIARVGTNIPVNEEIELLRPKSPIPRRT